MNKKELDFQLTLKYCLHQLSGGNELSRGLARYVNFEKGNFYTLLPGHPSRARLHQFELGGILPKNPEISYSLNGIDATFSIIPTMHDAMASFIEESSRINKLACIFEELLDSQSSPHLEYFHKKKLIYTHKNEVFYVIESNHIEHDIVIKCLEKSNAIWHSLCVLSSIDCRKIEHRNLTSQKIKALCIAAHFILIGAYDGEGYIIWERKHH